MKIWHIDRFGYIKSTRYTLLAVLFLFMAPPSWSSPAEEPKEFNIPILDSAQDLLGNRANFVANNFDSFFATERADDEFGRSRIRVRSAFTMVEDRHSEIKNQYRVNLRFPHLEDKFKFSYFEKDKDKKEKGGELADEPKTKAYVDDLNTGWIFNADANFALTIPPRVTTRARLRKNFQTGTVINRFTEEVTYVTTESGFVEETTLTSDITISYDLLFRFVNSKKWLINATDFTTGHGPVLLHRLTDRDAMGYSFVVATTVDNDLWYVTKYGVAVSYRRNLYKNWIYGDIVNGLDFPHDVEWRRVPYVTLQIELLFGS